MNTSIESQITDIDEEEKLQLSESIYFFRNRKLASQGNVFEGRITSGVYGIRPCAIKFARRSERNIHEAEILTKLASHGHVISIIQSGTYQELFDDSIYIALEKCHKLNLRQYLMSRKETMPVYDVKWGLIFIKQIITGMTFVHENLIIHKDMKPSNILLTEDLSTIKIADFDSSQEIRSNNSMVFSEFGFGTTGYRPPEGFGNSYISLKSDIFSLAVVFIFILSNGESPFGKEPKMWDYNIKNNAIALPRFLVQNIRATQHLLKLMLQTERCRRPTVVQVAEHPCWTGEDAICTFDYGVLVESEDSELERSLSQGTDSSSDPDSDIDNTTELVHILKALTTIRTSILLFPLLSKTMMRFDPNTGTMRRMHKYKQLDEFRTKSFSAVFLHPHIYILCFDTSAYRLRYGDNKPSWNRLSNMINRQFRYSSRSVAASREIYIVGAAPYSSEKYRPSENKWKRTKDKKFKTTWAAVVSCGKFIYSIGGLVNDEVTDKVERFDIKSETWNDVTPMIHARYEAGATEHNGKLFVIGGIGVKGEEKLPSQFIEIFSPRMKEWTTVKSNNAIGLGAHGCFSIDGYVYAFQFGLIHKYDVQRNTWKLIEAPVEDIYILRSVAVKEF